MRDIETTISHFIETQFPRFYREEGEAFVLFLKTYFEWLESTDNINFKTRRLLSYDDIDTTLDQYIEQFTNTYLSSVPSNTRVNRRTLVKYALDLYRAKGTERGYDILLKALYGEEPVIYYPADDILKASDGDWQQRRYIEISSVTNPHEYVGTRIVGVGSRAQGTVEKYYQQRIKNKIIDVFELSSLRGNFRAGEVITILGSTEKQNLPKVVGSLTSISVVDGGINFEVGDILDVVSTRGDRGKARVTRTSSKNGLVDFTLINGGSGYSLDTIPKIYPQIRLSSSNTIGNFQASQFIYQGNSTGIVVSANTDGIRLKQINSGFTKSTNVYSAIKLTLSALSGTFANGEYVYQSNGTANIGVGKIISVTNTSPNVASIYVSEVLGGNFFTTSTTTSSGNTHILVGNTSSAQGYVYTIEGGNSTGVALVSNVVGGGTGASFRIGNIIDRENITVNSDYIRDYINTKILVFNTASPLTGTVSVTSGSNTITGVGTSFTANFAVNDYVQVNTGVNKQIRQIATVTNNTSMSVTAVFGSSATSVSHFHDIANYAFTKLDSSNINTVISSALAYQQLEVGTIQYLNNINPGEGYSLDPYVELTQPIIAPLNIVESDGTVKGNNAVITADAGTRSGVIESVAVIDSGYGYEDFEKVTLTSPERNQVASGYPQITIQGKTSGEWVSTRGLLNSDKYIQDSYYYQEYSYEVGSKLDFNIYKDIVKKLLHPSGVALFGKFLLRSEMTGSQSQYVQSSIEQTD